MSLLEASSSLLDPVPVSENISLSEGVLVSQERLLYCIFCIFAD